MADGYRTEIFRVPDSAAYVQVFQRSGEQPLIECNFFEGNKDFGQAAALCEALASGLELCAKWLDKEEGIPVDRVDLLMSDE